MTPAKEVGTRTISYRHAVSSRPLSRGHLSPSHVLLDFICISKVIIHKSTLLKTVTNICTVGISDFSSGPFKFYPGHQQLSPTCPVGHPLLTLNDILVKVHGLIRQNLCGTGTGAYTMPKYRTRLSSHISCSVTV